MAFSTTKRGDIPDLKILLNDQKIDKRKRGMKKTISLMTQGHDVSSLFTDVLKCV